MTEDDLYWDEFDAERRPPLTWLAFLAATLLVLVLAPFLFSTGDAGAEDGPTYQEQREASEIRWREEHTVTICEHDLAFVTFHSSRGDARASSIVRVAELDHVCDERAGGLTDG